VKQGGPDQIELRFDGSVPVTSQLKLYQTTRAVDCRKTDDLQVVDGMAQLDMPENTVFTIVGKIDRHQASSKP